MKKTPAVEDYERNLAEKLKTTEALLKELKAAIMAGDYKSNELPEKVKFAELADRCRTEVSHAFTQPESPERVRSAQSQLENSGKNFDRDYLGRAETMRDLLAGQDVGSDLGKRLSRESNVPNVRENLSQAELAELQRQVSEAVERLKLLKPKIEATAREKALNPSVEERRLKVYEQQYDQYEKVQEELKGVLERVKK